MNTPTERNTYPSMPELEARRMGTSLWATAKAQIIAWGKRVGAKRVHVVDPKTMLRLETLEIPLATHQPRQHRRPQERE